MVNCNFSFGVVTGMVAIDIRFGDVCAIISGDGGSGASGKSNCHNDGPIVPAC